MNTNVTFSWGAINDVLLRGKKLQLTDNQIVAIEKSYHFLEQFASDKVIYGINTGFGPMAQWRVEERNLRDLQYNIIRSHSAGVGEPLGDLEVRAALLARLGTFLQARSGVHLEVVTLLTEFINRGIYPFIPQHGSVGASGDLVQLAHIGLALIGEGKVHYQNAWRNSGDVLRENGLKPLQMHIREGLAITNGTSVMTGISIVNQVRAEQLLNYALLAAVMMNEIAASFDDLMSEELNDCRHHSGQQRIAQQMRQLANGSHCLKKREHELYDNGHQERKTFKHKVQPYYSLRCTPQILGPILETLENARKIIVEEVNSACDNPIVDADAGNVFHGGNFHGDYISLEEDKVKIAVTRLVMTAERQLNYLFHDRINGILPPFLNLGVLGLNYGMQACQFTATSTTAECQTLAMPNYVHSIPNNNDNQDVVSMGTNSAILCQRVIENGFQVMAILYIALAQAVDCLNITEQLAPTSRNIYHDIRNIIPMIKNDEPFYEKIALVEEYLKSNPLIIK